MSEIDGGLCGDGERVYSSASGTTVRLRTQHFVEEATCAEVCCEVKL